MMKMRMRMQRRCSGRGRVCSCTRRRASNAVVATSAAPRRRSAVPTRDAASTTTSRPRATATVPGTRDLAAAVKVRRHVDELPSLSNTFTIAALAA